MEKEFVNNQETEQEKLSLGPASLEDAQAVWQIRNNPLNRKNFHSPEEISLEDHKKWFDDKYFQQKDNTCFVLRQDKAIIGYCRFDLKGDEYSVSIAIAPEYQNQGLGDKLLRQSIEALNSDKDITAEVIKGNESSRRLFEKNNFDLYRQDDNTFYFRYQPKKQ